MGALRAVGTAFVTGLLDLLSAPQCAACDHDLNDRSVFCRTCADSVVRAEPPYWPMAPAAVLGQAPSPIGVLSFGHYGGAIADALQRFKYDDRPDLARPLGALLCRTVRELRPGSRGAAAAAGCDLVLPVPLHPRRLAERGYNQASLLAGQVQRELGGRLATAGLRRVKDTPPQAKLDRVARAQNVATAFQVVAPERLRDRRVMLVDDVATTGATLLACAGALRRAGVAAVDALVVAVAEG